MSALTWQYKSFSELKPEELYLILRLRADVFVLEQQCLYQDIDSKDQTSFHLSAWAEGLPVAYLRVMPPGLSYEDASIGRVCTASSHRRTGAGRTLMIKGIEHARKHFPRFSIRIGAQQYLEQFYSSLGFKSTGKEYLEDGIQHVEMILDHQAV